jgi:hypothetical protein
MARGNGEGELVRDRARGPPARTVGTDQLSGVVIRPGLSRPLGAVLEATLRHALGRWFGSAAAPGPAAERPLPLGALAGYDGRAEMGVNWGRIPERISPGKAANNS